MRARIGLIGLAVLSVLLLVIVCGCQAAPGQEAVTSKNDGAFESALESTAEETPKVAAEPEMYTDSFTNTDGDISFQVELDTPAVTSSMPVLRVRPKTITSECAKQVAEVLFGDADIYEYSENWSKAKLEELILSLRQRLADPDAMEKYYGGMKDKIGEQMEAAISAYEEEYATAPETVEVSPCSWEFHPRSWYYNQAWVNEDDPEEISNNKSQWIVATSERNGLPYIYSVCNREEEDYRIHNITCEVNWELMEEELIYSTQIPAEAEIKEAQAEAEAMLNAMDLGEWVIDSCVTQEIGSPDGSSKYTIVVTACPVYNGVKVSHQQQLESLRTDDAYASNYYYEEMIFSFSGGNLVSFMYQSPLDVVDMVNKNVAILSFEEAMEKFKSQMQMSLLAEDPYAISDSYQAERKDVGVYQAELGLVRTRIKDNSTDFYLLPAYTFRASYILYDQNGALVFDSKIFEQTGLGTKELLVINAVDGSVINTQLGY